VKTDNKQSLSNEMAQSDRIRRELVQLSRYAARGDTERARIQIVRLIRSLRQSGDSLGDDLHQAVFESEDNAAAAPPTRTLRRAVTTGLSALPPIDSETRLDILRVEDPPQLDTALVFPTELARSLERVVVERRASGRLAKAGLAPAKSLLFLGPPGVGKTMAARQIALQIQVPLLVVDLAALISSLLGRTGNNLKQAFAFAQHRPCVLLLDEIDAIGKRRNDDSDIGELKRLVTVLLQELDLWSGKNLLIAATNHPELLDPALYRRFDETLRFPLPTPAQLEALGQQLVGKQDVLPPEWLELLVRIDHRRSHSDFVRDLNRLRRGYVLGGRQEAARVAASLLSTDAQIPMEDRKRIAVFLHRHANLPQREASVLAGVARETLRTALKAEEGDGS
jgi:SpoVK/Ycf46/Vps4 family AAA+-type ATPase